MGVVVMTVWNPVAHVQNDELYALWAIVWFSFVVGQSVRAIWRWWRRS